jgi:hypothetical protein
VLVRWPEDATEGHELARSGAAVLYLVNGDDAPPTPAGCLEDWIRIPGDDRDLGARLAALELRASSHDAGPRVDEHGRLRYQGRQTPLPPDVVELVRVLADQFGCLVPDHALVAALGGTTTPSLRTQMTQLRARVRVLDLTLRRVPRKGYLLK